jgi:hypothetical protein
MITGSSLTASLITAFLNGEIYVNVHTDSFPTGELRGQLYTLARDGYSFDICGWQQFPNPLFGPGFGSGMVSIDRKETNAHYMVAYSNLTGTNLGTHFHNAAQGANGGVVYDILSTITNSQADEYWTDNDPVTDFSSFYANEFREGRMYINIHTALFTSGEIRGQVVKHLICAPFISIEEENSFTGVNLYPNPANDLLTLDFNALNPSNGSIELYSIQGSLISSGNFSFQTGNNQVQIDIHDLISGMYFVKINSKLTSPAIIKFVKQ